MSLTNKKIRVLFVAHEATKSGAPIVLLHILRWLRHNSNIEFEILFKKGGELIEEFDEISKVHILRKILPNRFLKNAAPFYVRLFQIPLTLLFKRFDVIYSNTATNGVIVAALRSQSRLCITHVHELDTAISGFGTKNWDMIFKQTNKYIAVSKAVSNDLLSRNVSKSIISIIPPCTQIPNSNEDARRRIRKDIGVPEDAFLICGGGYVSWTKGSDLFIQLAKHINNKISPKVMHFIWFGPYNETAKRQLLYDIEKLGLVGKVHIIGFVKNSSDYIKASDVFALTSRADSQPLVAIEAGMLGRPIVCFESAGGTSEWVRNHAGFTLPYLDIEAMGEAILSLYNDQDLRAEKAKKATEISKSIFEIEKVSGSIEELIRTLANN